MSALSNKLKFGPQRSGMTHARWREVSRIQMPRRLIHVSKELPYEVPNPLAGRNGNPAVMPPMQIQPGGITYRAGRNIAKGARRELRIRKPGVRKAVAV
jgi:hypothetical protein